MVRELIGGAYFGDHITEEKNGEKVATDMMTYSEHEIERIARTAFNTARKRGKRVISVDKANVLDSSRLWRAVVHKVAEEYPDVTCTDMLVDNTAMQLVKDPSQFDAVSYTHLDVYKRQLPEFSLHRSSPPDRPAKSTSAAKPF